MSWNLCPPRYQTVTALIQVSIILPLDHWSHALSGLLAFSPTSHHFPFSRVERVTTLNHKLGHVSTLLAIY